jgi:iron(III) transport system ATP-binding protein
MSTAISIRDLTKTYPPLPGARKSAAVDNISLEIASGELFFLLGPSGCGKTTLLRMIAGFIEPTNGSIAFNGTDVTYAPANRRNTGMVFQSYALWPHMTVEANVRFGLEIRGIPASEATKSVRDALAAVRMEEYAARKPNQLSGGQQQRVALARALVIRPDVLLLDEPLSNLDAKLRIELRSEIRRICKTAGITTVYVTHDQKEALSMADRVAIIRSGRLVQSGPPEELYRKPSTRFVAEFLGETNLLPAERLGPNLLRIAGVDLAASDIGAGRLASIRPESIRRTTPSSGGNLLRGKLIESTYLGESVQFHVELETGVVIRCAESNPPLVRPAVGDLVVLTVAPNDIALVSDDQV